MDDHPFAHLGSWRVVVIIGGIIAVILFLSFLLTAFSSGENRTQNTGVQNAGLPGSSNVVIPTSSQPYVASINGGAEQYRGNTFSVLYPSSWNVGESESLGSMVTTFGEDTGSNSASPQLIVSTLAKTSATYSLLDGKEALRLSGYQESTVKVDGIQADQLTGVYPPKSMQSQTSSDQLFWQTNIYLTKGSTEYVIRYVYPGNKKDENYEKLFTSMLSTIRLY